MKRKSPEKVVLTIELEHRVKSSAAYGIASKSIEAMLRIKNIDPESVYIGGNKEFLIRYLANLITQFQFELTDDTIRFKDDVDFSS